MAMGWGARGAICSTGGAGPRWDGAGWLEGGVHALCTGVVVVVVVVMGDEGKIGGDTEGSNAESTCTCNMQKYTSEMQMTSNQQAPVGGVGA